MSAYTTTPWSHPTALLSLRGRLYSPTTTPESQTHAIAQIQAWKLRGSNLPHAIESTALLIDAQLFHRQCLTAQSQNHDRNSKLDSNPKANNDEVGPGAAPGNSTHRIRTLYTSAFTRFVTGFCDIGRNRERSLEPSSMLAIARQIGMPEAWVALRHEGVHEEVPSLRRLVEAVEGAVGWLREVYWSRLGGEADGEGGEVREEVREILKEWRRARVEGLRSGKGEVEMQRGVGEMVEGFVDLCGAWQGRWREMATVLVEDRLLVPGQRELGSNLEGAFLIWEELLNILFGRFATFRSLLVRALLDELAATSTSDPAKDANKEAFAIWALHLAGEDGSLRVDVVKWCCLHPGHWSEYVGRQMLREASISEDWEEAFDASLLSSDMRAPRGVVDVRGERDPMSHPAKPIAKSSGEVAPRSKTGWTRAALPIAAPIGLVR